MNRDRDRWRSRLHAVGLAALAFLLVGALWSTPYLPTNDGPEWVFASHMENHYADPDTLYRAVFVPALQFACRGFTVLLTPLEDLLGWQNGLRAAESIAALLAAFGLATLVSAVDRQRAALAFVAFPLALTWHFYMGFFAFGVGSAIGFFVLALALRWHDPSPGQRALLAALLLLGAVAHVFSAVLTGLALLVMMVTRAPRLGRIREALVVTLMGLPAASILVASVVLARGVAKMTYDDEGFAFLPPSLVLTVFPRTLVPGPLWRAVLVCVLAAAGLVFVARRGYRPGTSATDRALAMLAVGLFLLGVFGPINVPRWQFFSQRFLPLGAALLLASLPLEKLEGQTWQGRASVGLFALSAVWLLASYPMHRRLFDSCRAAVAGLASPVRRHRDWLPVTLAPEGTLPRDPTQREVPFIAPLRHIEALYAASLGGLTPYYFADSAAVYPFTLRPDGLRPPPVPLARKVFADIDSDAFVTDLSFRHAVEDHLATFGMFYEGVLVTGATADDLSLWQSRGYETEWQEEGTLLAHFVPCHVDVVLSDPAVGVPKVDLGVDEDVVFRDQGIAFEQAPCGHVWVRPHWDRSPPLHCRNGNNEGRVAAQISRTISRVSCLSP